MTTRTRHPRTPHVLVILGLVAACRSQPPTDAPPPPAPPAAPTPLLYAAPMVQGTEVGVQRARVVAEFLSEALGRPVEARLFAYEQLGRSVAEGKADVAVLPPLDFLRASAGGKLVPVRQALHGGASQYRPVLFVRADRAGATTVESLRGLSVAWVREGSASGWLMPRFALSQLGIDPDTFFGKPTQHASHSEVCEAVLAGRSEVGASFTDASTARADARVIACEPVLGERVSELRIVEVFAPLPTEVVAVRSDVEIPVRDALSKALDSLAETVAGRHVLREGFASDGFVPPDDASFAGLRALLAAGEAPPTKE